MKSRGKSLKCPCQQLIKYTSLLSYLPASHQSPLKGRVASEKVAFSTSYSRIQPVSARMTYIPSPSFENSEPQIYPLQANFQNKMRANSNCWSALWRQTVQESLRCHIAVSLLHRVFFHLKLMTTITMYAKFVVYFGE